MRRETIARLNEGCRQAGRAPIGAEHRARARLRNHSTSGPPSGLVRREHQGRRPSCPVSRPFRKSPST
jgi:hypothetical protein